MAGKRGLIMGVANNHSIAWGIASVLAREGAELAFTYQGDAFRKRVEPLIQSIGASFLAPCDVEDEDLDRRPVRPAGHGMGVDRLPGPRHRLFRQGRAEGPLPRHHGRELQPHHADQLLQLHRAGEAGGGDHAEGGSLLTLTYLGAERVMPNYNVMGVAKAALEASVRYLAADLGPQAVRVNAISAGPMRTLAGSAIGDARYVFRFNQQNSPLRKNVTLDEVGNAALYLLGPLSTGVTGEVHHVDAGYHAIGMPAAPRNSEAAEG